ncbi:MAG TPA: serine protease [Thermoanaerobaculia bacterium]|nr:serine protease [Thermoanaerobaculia bacterium]
MKRVLLSATLAMIATGTVAAQRAIPDDNLAYPASLVLEGDGAGSGFFLNTTGATYLVTSKHLLLTGDPPKLRSNSVTVLSFGRDLNDSGRNRFVLDLVALKTAGVVYWHATRDVVLIKLGTIQEGKLRPFDGVTMIAKASSGILGASIANLKKLSDVLVANDVYVFGYPRSLGLADLPQLDPDRPLLRKGIIAGINPALQSIVIDCPVYPGNSGGPVLEVHAVGLDREFRIIGLVSEFVPFVETWTEITHGWTNHTISNSGYSIVVPADFILQVIPQ